MNFYQQAIFSCLFVLTKLITGPLLYVYPVRTGSLIACREQPYDLAFYYWHCCSLKSVNIFIIKLRLFSGTMTLVSRRLPSCYRILSGTGCWDSGSLLWFVVGGCSPLSHFLWFFRVMIPNYHLKKKNPTFLWKKEDFKVLWVPPPPPLFSL